MSEARSYKLLCNPWIPVVWRNDVVEPKAPKIGIQEALHRAHAIQCVSHTAPFIEFGLYRLLITIVLDAYIVSGQRPTIGKLRAMLEKGQFNEFIIDGYLKSHNEHLNLWAKDGPFLQHRLATDGGKQPSPKAVVSMFPAIPSGTNVAHWHHYGEDEAGLSEDIAAQLLTTVSPFNFKVKPGEARTLAGDPPMYALVLGGNLFETIVLNLPRSSGRITAKQEQNNGPAWRTQLDIEKLPKMPTVAQGFTWPVRVIELEYDGAMVTKAINLAAYKKPTDKAKEKGGKLYDAKYGWRDPNAGIETTRDAITHIKARPDVPIWRDAVPLFLVASEGEALRADRRRSRPEVISNALRVLDAPQFRVAVYGMRKKSGGGGDVKVEEWFRSVLKFPTEVARDSRLSSRAVDGFKTTQNVAVTLQHALRMLRPPVKASKGKKPPPGRADGDALADFWQRLEPVLSRTYLDELGSGDSEADARLHERIRKEARDAFARAAGPHRRTADGLFRIANASNWLEGQLSRRLPKQRQEKQS
ncbi:MAG: type I-E CRISPR-associated protein Cse1/CasA [Thermodesulfobacteriota bacterium]